MPLTLADLEIAAAAARRWNGHGINWLSDDMPETLNPGNKDVSCGADAVIRDAVAVRDKYGCPAASVVAGRHVEGEMPARYDLEIELKAVLDDLGNMVRNHPDGEYGLIEGLRTQPEKVAVIFETEIVRLKEKGDKLC